MRRMAEVKAMQNRELRVLSGKFKGRKFQSPVSKTTHPMGAREKLALFNMLQSYLEGARVLDAYAGTGALGLEALSRGAKEAVFVESNGRVARIMNTNLDQVLGAEFTFATIYSYPVQDFAQIATYHDYFDVIIADPPYDDFQLAEVVTLAKCLKESGILALSYPAKQHTPEISGLELISDRHYAAAGIAIYRKV